MLVQDTRLTIASPEVHIYYLWIFLEKIINIIQYMEINQKNHQMNVLKIQLKYILSHQSLKHEVQLIIDTVQLYHTLFET